MRFEDLGIDKRLLTALDHKGITNPTEIQQKAIPLALAGKDLLASSKTGSGKTLAFLLPAFQRISRSRALSKQDPRVVILVPTRELAKQVYAELRMMVGPTNHTAALILGGENFNDQAKMFRKNPTFVVATPGRLADHLEHRNLFLDGLELLILDEADRMLDLGFAPQLNAINEAASHRLRQTLMFSATLDHELVDDIAGNMLKKPTVVRVGEIFQQHGDISERFVLCDHLDHKEALLEKVLNEGEHRQVMVFTATREDTDRLAALLSEQGFKAIGLSGSLNQSTRNRIMDEFERGQHEVLVTTDLASRGLDLNNVSLVINFDMPKHSEEYIHRIGRTGRAGKKGDALSLIGPKDWVSFKKIEKFLHKTMVFSEFDGLVAKFKGFHIRNQNKKPKNSSSKKTTGPKTPVKKVQKNRNKSFYTNVPVGDAPFVPKKRREDQE